jgi:hypothetical protein
MSIREIMLLKIISPIICVLVYLLVAYTNHNIQASNIIGQFSYSQNDFMAIDKNKDNVEYNIILYYEIIKRGGQSALGLIASEKRIEYVSRLLPEILGKEAQGDLINERANNFDKTFEAVRSTSVALNFKLLIFIIFPFFFPEMYMLLKYYLHKTKIEKEVIKLENIFSLLANIPDFKTDSILKEMEQSTKIFNRHFGICLKKFYEDREIAINELMDSSRNKRFKSLVNSIKKYSLVDKRMALQMMERNVKENEERLIINANEDMDITEMIALLSIAPFALLSLVISIKPLFDTAMSAFNFF